MVIAEPKRSHSRPAKGAKAPINSIETAVPKENSSRATCSSAETGLRKMQRLWRTPKPMVRTRKPHQTAVQYEREVMPEFRVSGPLPRIELLHALPSYDVAQRADAIGGFDRAGSIPAVFGRRCLRRRAAAGGRAPRVQTAERRQDRVLHAVRVGEPREAAEQPRRAAQGRHPQGQAADRGRSGDL